MVNNDIEGALEYIIEERREVCREAFYLIKEKLPEIFSEKGELKISEFDGSVAQGENIVFEGDVKRSYPVKFCKDGKGEWKIEEY